MLIISVVISIDILVRLIIIKPRAHTVIHTYVYNSIDFIVSYSRLKAEIIVKLLLIVFKFNRA